MHYNAAKQFILKKLRTELSDHLFYHGLHHTLDVTRMAANICQAEGIKGRMLKLVKTAALFHDAGFIKNKHQGHEAEGCALVRTHLPVFGYTPEDIEIICGMIMATKIPQSPKNLPEKILCDADLDYLGRSDFYSIGQTLYKELQTYHIISGEENWNNLQVGFLANHQFHTRTNLEQREPVKQVYLRELKTMVAKY